MCLIDFFNLLISINFVCLQYNDYISKNNQKLENLLRFNSIKREMRLN